MVVLAFENCRKFTRDNPEAKALEDRFSEVVAWDDRPSEVQVRGFASLWRIWISLSSCCYSADVSRHDLYDLGSAHIRGLINDDVSGRSFTAHVQTSVRFCAVGMLGLTAKWMVEDLFVEGKECLSLK